MFYSDFRAFQIHFGVGYKKLIKDGPLGKPGGTVPTPPVAPAVPTIVAPGIFPRISQMVTRLKNYPTYTEAIGRDLGIIGAEEAVDTDTMKPVLKLLSLAGNVGSVVGEGHGRCVYIETDKGAGWQFLAVDAVPHYIDTTPITAQAVWKYRAIYLIADEKVGQMSDVVSINVS